MTTSQPELRVLGIDPGLANVGWGIVERRPSHDPGGSSFRSLAHGVVRTRRSGAHAERLMCIFEQLRAVISEYRPAVAAVEEVFQSPSPRSAFLAGEGRGACILAAASQGLGVMEYPPPVVKLAVTGNGRASKPQVQAMVQRLLGLTEIPRPHDAADALAIAVTHLQRVRTGVRLETRS